MAKWVISTLLKAQLGFHCANSIGGPQQFVKLLTQIIDSDDNDNDDDDDDDDDKDEDDEEVQEGDECPCRWRPLKSRPIIGQSLPCHSSPLFKITDDDDADDFLH